MTDSAHSQSSSGRLKKRVEIRKWSPGQRQLFISYDAMTTSFSNSCEALMIRLRTDSLPFPVALATVVRKIRPLSSPRLCSGNGSSSYHASPIKCLHDHKQGASIFTRRSWLPKKNSPRTLIICRNTIGRRAINVNSQPRWASRYNPERKLISF